MIGDSNQTTNVEGIDLSALPDFELGRLRIRPARREICSGEDCRDLEPRVMKVLVALARARPSVLSRDRIIQECWDGRIVSDDALNRSILSLRHAIRDYPDAGFQIETVPRVGYSLVEARQGNFGGVGALWRRFLARNVVLTVLVFVGVLLAAGASIWTYQVARIKEPVSIAVLPFRNLAPSDPFFAEGMSEEILTRLSREPAFKVSGRTSSSQFRDATDLRKVGRKLDVDYVLEGSVRSQHRTVRVDAALVRISDGARIWAKSYDGDLNRTFDIQNEIGTAVANALALKLVRTPRTMAARPARGEAYNLYLTARGLIRTRRRDYSQAEIELLNQAIRIDPKFAPAWARLAEATQMAATSKGREAVIAAQPVAEAQARRALALDEDLAEAHVALGGILGFGSPEAQSHLRRAIELDPNNAHNQVWMGLAYKATGAFGKEIAAYRRAYELDPYWFRARREWVIALADRGQRATAEKIGKVETMMLARIAWSYGDFSEAIRLWEISLRSDANIVRAWAERGIATSRFLVGLEPTPPPPSIFPPAADIGRGVSIAWLAKSPSPSEWRSRTRDPVAAQILHWENLYAAKMMLNAGRDAELRASYDGPVGLLGIRRGQDLRAVHLWSVPSVALALQRGGREKEARHLLTEALALIEAIVRREWTPFSFEASAAGVFAASGQDDRALGALETAWRRGWRTIYMTGPLDLADDPAFRHLRGNPRLERLRSEFAAHWQRERDEIARLQR